MKKHFKPEFLNRLDGTVIFRALSRESLTKVIDLEVAKLQKRLIKKNIHVDLDEKAKAFIIEKGYVPEMGARPLRRTVEQLLEDPLSEKLLLDPNTPRDYLVTANETGLEFIETKKPVDQSKSIAMKQS